jgi:hypothetical protein
VVLAGVVLVGALAGRPAGAADLVPPLPTDVRAHYEAAMEHYAAKEYEAALRELAVAYAAEPRREILFAQAQATRLAGDCAGALPLYEKFLATAPPARQVEATRIAVARCAAAAAKPPQESPAAAMPGGPVPGEPLTATPAAGASTAPPARIPPIGPAPARLAADLAPRTPLGGALGLEQRGLPPPPPSRRWYRDPVAGVLAGAALASAGVGVGLLVSARREDGQARAMPSAGYAQYDERRRSAEARERWGRAVALVGGALALGAAGRYLWLALGEGGRGVIAEGHF